MTFCCNLILGVGIVLLGLSGAVPLHGWLLAGLVVNQAGLLIGLLASPILFSILDAAPMVMVCRRCVLAVRMIGLSRFSNEIWE